MATMTVMTTVVVMILGMMIGTALEKDKMTIIPGLSPDQMETVKE